MFTNSLSSGGQLTKDRGQQGGQNAKASPECGEQYRMMEPILLSKSDILFI